MTHRKHVKTRRKQLKFFGEYGKLALFRFTRETYNSYNISSLD
jgi:hypothetical protein